jgi:hypothetical protein
LAEVDAQWQRTGPAPRADAATLDLQFRNARDAVRQNLASYAQRSWHATCDALLAKLALCEALERGPDSAQTRATFEQRWSALPVLPPAWEQALARRASLDAAASGKDLRTTASADDLLLQLEAAFQLDSPAAFQATRRELKLRAMKAALESRPSAASAPPTPQQLLAKVLELTALDDEQRERLGKVIAALRGRGPASAG